MFLFFIPFPDKHLLRPIRLLKRLVKLHYLSLNTDHTEGAHCNVGKSRKLINAKINEMMAGKKISEIQQISLLNTMHGESDTFGMHQNQLNPV